ncbi:MAG: SRPBCC family protein [Bacteriovorax sp.]|nr:SRPBCC family protein [Bacteriovorax sp.]
MRAPKSYKVTRSIIINATPAEIFPYANNPRIMQEWNPFTMDDPTLKMTYFGPAEGIGAQSTWDGNSKTGKGQATVIESEMYKKVTVRLEFEKPFKGTNRGEYLLEEKVSSTIFIWSLYEESFVPRVLSQVINLDKMIGDQFERGLAKLKTIVESKGK